MRPYADTKNSEILGLDLYCGFNFHHRPTIEIMATPVSGMNWSCASKYE